MRGLELGAHQDLSDAARHLRRADERRHEDGFLTAEAQAAEQRHDMGRDGGEDDAVQGESRREEGHGAGAGRSGERRHGIIDHGFPSALAACVLQNDRVDGRQIAKCSTA